MTCPVQIAFGESAPMKRVLVLALTLSALVPAHAQELRNWAIVQKGSPAASIVILERDESNSLLAQAGQYLQKGVRRWTGRELHGPRWVGEAASLPRGTLIVLATLDNLRRVLPDLAQSNPVARQAAFLDDHGFVCAPAESEGFTGMLVVSRTARGVFNGAVYVRDFLMLGTKSDLYLSAKTVVRSPQMGGRPVYLLTIWGNEDEYSVSDFKLVFDSFARDGMDRVYFWLSGHFPSARFPQTYKVADVLKGITYDSTKESRIATLEEQRQLIREAHARSLKFYLGGALGGWVGTLFLTHLEPETFKVRSIGDAGVDQSDESLCPSNAKVRQSLIQYYKEMFDALPEADGLFIESADEMGGCRCPVCDQPVDTLGSRRFGQAQLTLVHEIMQEVWRDHPHARLAYTIGYNPHRKDPAYYETIRQMRDPRLEWMEARDSWEFPGAEGKPLPAASFSQRLMGWRYHDRKPLAEMVSDISRMGREGWHGCISTFSPGFSSGSVYNKIPLPTDALPYVVTHFVHRELTWDSLLTEVSLRQRLQERFFGVEAPASLGSDLWDLRELIRKASEGVWGINAAKAWDYLGCKPVSQELRVQITGIEQRIKQNRAVAGPKTLETLDMMAMAIEDLRRHCGGAR